MQHSAVAGAPRDARDNTNSLGSDPCSNRQRDHSKYNNILISLQFKFIGYVYGNGQIITNLKLTETA